MDSLAVAGPRFRRWTPFARKSVCCYRLPEIHRNVPNWQSLNYWNTGAWSGSTTACNEESTQLSATAFVFVYIMGPGSLSSAYRPRGGSTVMATASSKAIMGALAEKLKALLGREYDLQVGVREDVEFLQSELEFMHAFLRDNHDARYQQTTTSAHVVKVWKRKVLELAYHVEDAIDDFTCRVGPAPKEIPDMVKHFVYTLMARHQIAKQLRRLRRQAQELSKQHKRYVPLALGTTPPSPSSTAVQVPPQPLVYHPDETTTNLLVGIDGPRDEFIANLTSAATKHRSGRRRVASMVGMAGVGKTTLAKAVYHSLEDLFLCRAFVTVSRQLDTRRVLKDILQQVMITTGSGSSPGIASMETWEDSQFVDTLRDNLKDKRFDSLLPAPLPSNSTLPVLFSSFKYIFFLEFQLMCSVGTRDALQFH